MIDKGGSPIYDKDTIIEGDNPDKHIEYTVCYDSESHSYRAKNWTMPNVCVSRPLEWIASECFVKPKQ